MNDEGGYVYLILASNGLFKIGSSKIPQQRFGAIRSACPLHVELFAISFFGDYYVDVESIFHEQFKHKRIRGEWFSLDEDDLHYILNWDGGCINYEGVMSRLKQLKSRGFFDIASYIRKLTWDDLLKLSAVTELQNQ